MKTSGKVMLVCVGTIMGIIEGSLEAKLPTIWRDGNGAARKKLGRGESPEGRVRREKIRDGEDQRWRKAEERRCRCAKR